MYLEEIKPKKVFLKSRKFMKHNFRQTFFLVIYIFANIVCQIVADKITDLKKFIE